MVIRARQQIINTAINPLFFLKRTTKTAMSITTTMVLQMGLLTIGVTTLITVIAQLSTMTFEYLRGDITGVGVFVVKSSRIEKVLKLLFKQLIHHQVDQKEISDWLVYSFVSAGKPLSSRYYCAPTIP